MATTVDSFSKLQCAHVQKLSTSWYKATLCTLHCTGGLSMARSRCFAVWGRVFLFSSCNDLILYTLISHVNPPLWATTHRGPNVFRRWHRPLQKAFSAAIQIWAMLGFSFSISRVFARLVNLTQLLFFICALSNDWLISPALGNSITLPNNQNLVLQIF